MDIVLWIIQVILAIKLVTTAYTHSLRQGQPEMQTAIQRMGRATPALLWLTASGCLLAAAGLVLPGIFSAADWIIARSALFSGVLLVVSFVCHVRGRDKPKAFVSLVLLAFAAVIVYGRGIAVY